MPEAVGGPGGGGWHLWPWLCTPCPRHVAVGVCHLRALVRLWVSLQLLSVAALKIEQRIRSSQRFLLAGAFNASLAAGFVGEGGVKVCVWGAEAHGIDRAGGCPFPAPLQDPRPHAWGGGGQEAVPPPCAVAAASPATFLFCFSELKLLFPPDSGVALPLLPCRRLLSAARSVLSPGPTSVFHRGVFFLEVVHQLPEYFPCSCCLPRVKRLFLRCSFLGASVVSWLRRGRPVLPCHGEPRAAAAPPDRPAASPRLLGVTLPMEATSPSLVLDSRVRNARQSRCSPGEGSGRFPVPAGLELCSATLRRCRWQFGDSQMAVWLCPGEAQAASRRCWKEQRGQVAG